MISVPGKRSFIVLFSFMVLVGMNGCARRVTADTYAVPQLAAQDFPTGGSFYVAPNENIPNPIFDRRIKEKIEMLLRLKGFSIEPAVAADFWLKYSYGMIGREEVQFRTIPHTRLWPRDFYYTGGISPYYFDSHLYYSTVVADTYPVYTAQLRLQVFNGTGNADQTPKSSQALWVGEISTETENRELRKMVDYLLVAAMRFLGHDTREPEKIAVPEEDGLLKKLREVEKEALPPDSPPEEA